MLYTTVLKKLLVSYNGNQDIRTPYYIFNELNKEFNFDLDPCTSSGKKGNLGIPFFDETTDGLKQSWLPFKSVFVNPPFNDMKNWIAKIFHELEIDGGKTVVLLAPAKTETAWFHDLLRSKFLKELRFQKGRVTFEGFTTPFVIGVVYFILGG
jgi:site-specific DNA-methyltransferase (adenine-specific)